MQENRNLCVLVPNFLNKGPQIGNGPFFFVRQFFIVNRENKARSARLLLREGSQIAVAGDAQNLQPLLFDRFRQRANTEARSIF